LSFFAVVTAAASLFAAGLTFCAKKKIRRQKNLQKMAKMKERNRFNKTVTLV
jgi:Na+-translocating ferredoxin:NAD+ oxidoreductase RnfG subunit